MPELSKEDYEGRATRRQEEQSERNAQAHGLFLIDWEHSRAGCPVRLETHIADRSSQSGEQDFGAGEHEVCPHYWREAESPLHASRCQPRTF